MRLRCSAEAQGELTLLVARSGVALGVMRLARTA
jgi:hypothetical protein